MGKKEFKYYTLDRIKSQEAQYNIAFGERSNGKTYAGKMEILKDYFDNGKQGAYIRRWDDDIKGVRGAELWKDALPMIEKMSDGKYNKVVYRSRRFYMACGDDMEEEPFCYAFALNVAEHDKSSSFPDVRVIVFDEFLTRGVYIPQEFIAFTNLISTIARNRKDIKIYMFGNTVNKYCPYFAEMGLGHVKEMKPADLEVYTYGDSGLRVAVEYTGNATSQYKESNVLFAFNNPKLNMIKRGSWEIDIYPHIPLKYAPRDIMLVYFIKFDGELLQADVVRGGVTMDSEQKYIQAPFTYIHEKTTDIKNPEKDIIFSLETLPNYNHYTYLNEGRDKLSRAIWRFYSIGKVFYQNNEVGEIVRNYIKNCKNIS